MALVIQQALRSQADLKQRKVMRSLLLEWRRGVEENHLPRVVEGEEKVLNLGWWAVDGGGSFAVGG